jgi:hypothetical protein
MALLKKGLDLQQWVDSYTHWPNGLALLFQSGYTPTESCLTSACEADCEESVKLVISTQKYYLGPSELEVASNHHNSAVVELVVQALIDRRRRLQVLAETYLPDEVISQLGIRPDNLLSLQAYKVYQLLKTSSIDVDDVKEWYTWSVYDYIGTNLKLADHLWDAGFQDVDEVDDGNKTCLMKLWWNSPPCSLNVLLEKANWLINKGADIGPKRSGSRALHYLGQTVGKNLHFKESLEDFALEIDQLSERSKDLLLTILVDNTRDGCCCPCSLKGCSGLTTLLNGLFRTWPEKGMGDLVQMLAIMIKSLIGSLGPEIQESLIYQLAPCVLRFITCQSLEISHTCVHGLSGGIDAEEIREIHDEEKLLILELDKLVVEFLSTSNRLGLSFLDFLTDYWSMQMDEALLSRGPPSEEDISQILETGVVLYK